MRNQAVREIHHGNYYSKTKVERRVSYNDSIVEVLKEQHSVS
jgi:hypothetical protein